MGAFALLMTSAQAADKDIVDIRRRGRDFLHAGGCRSAAGLV